jgi:hypothetical protein
VHAILDDDSGDKAEEATGIILRHEGLPDGSGEPIELKSVIPGTYAGRKGIDLVSATPDGRPVQIEVKKRASKTDSVGEGGADQGDLEPETLALGGDILRERELNPGLHYRRDIQLGPAALGPELSAEQMAGLWTRDRWLKLVKGNRHRARLLEAGVADEYLDLNNLSVAADTPQWRALLDGRTTVIVSGFRDSAGSTLADEAMFKRGFSVVMLNLDA